VFMKVSRFARFSLIGLTAISVVSAAAPGFAQSIPSGLFRDSNNHVYLMNQTPSAPVTLTYTDAVRTRNLTASACGTVTISGTTTNPIPATFTVGGTAIDVAALPTQLLPRCTNGALEEARTANFKTAAGQVVLVGQSPNAAVQMSYSSPRDRAARANACGFVRWSSTASAPQLPTTNVRFGNGSVTAIGSLPTMTPPYCRTGNLYVPASWLSSGGGGS
jgi:hypothetical protein